MVELKKRTKINMRTKKEWATIRLTLTIESDDNKDIYNINLSDGNQSISFDEMPSLKTILEDFDR